MQRVIMHVDMDSYFASVEQQARPSLRGKPIGVTGRPTERSIVVAASREAKQYKVWTGMPVWEALKACPDLVLVAGNPERYLSVTKQFVEILKRYTGLLEIYSVDEAFLDVTQEAPKYGGPIRMAEEIRRRFREELGDCITATVGIASGKTFAKLIGARSKPDGIGRLDDEEMPELLESTPTGDVWGIGRRIEARLKQAGIRTLRELGDVSERFLKREFGVYGLHLHEIGQGRDSTPLVPYTEVPPPKSVGHSKSLPPELRDFSLALIVLRDLCDKVAQRMRRLGYMGRTVHCGFRIGSIGPHHGKQTTLDLPSDDGETIYEACLVVLEKIPVKPGEVSNVGVSVGNLVATDRTPYSLLETDRRRDRLNQAVDRIRDRFGDRSVRLGTSLLVRPIPQHVGGFFMASDDLEIG
jgi:DNA polymerase-4